MAADASVCLFGRFEMLTSSVGLFCLHTDVLLLLYMAYILGWHRLNTYLLQRSGIIGHKCSIHALLNTYLRKVDSF